MNAVTVYELVFVPGAIVICAPFVLPWIVAPSGIVGVISQRTSCVLFVVTRNRTSLPEAQASCCVGASST